MSKSNILVLRIQSPDGTKRIQIGQHEPTMSLYEKVHDAFNLREFRFVLYKERGQRGELVSSGSKTLFSYGIKHGDMIYMTPLVRTVEWSPDNESSDASTFGESSSSSSSQSATSGINCGKIKVGSTHIEEDEVDLLLWKQDGKIQRKKDEKLCRHGTNACCVHCSPLEPFDENYLKEQNIKHLSFHSYLRKLTAGVDRGKFLALENISCSIKTGCKEHPPWPKGICSKCQPNAITLNRQIYRHTDNVMFENPHLVERFLNFWRSSGLQRVGFLYGKYEIHTDVPLGIRATVAAIYEPPQESTKDSITLLPDEREQIVEELAQHLGLVRVGWIFTDLIADDVQKGTVKHVRNAESHFLSAQECITAGFFQNQRPSPCRFSSTGYFGSKFVTVCVTGDASKQVHMEGYQVSGQCMALVRDGCLVPTKDAPELGYISESSDKKFVPDVFYKVKDSYGNEVPRLARPLPVEYLLVDVPASTPLVPQFTFTADASIRSFQVENRLIFGHVQDFAALSSYMSQFSPDQFLKAVSDFHLLLYIATMDVLPMREFMVPLLEAVREQDSRKAIEWSQSDQWATVEQVMAASSGTSNTRPGQTSMSGLNSFVDNSHNSPQITSWTCAHCTFMNPSNAFLCEICNLPRPSASVPTSYSRLTDLHDATNRLTSKERSETNDNLLNYRRSSKTDSDVAATFEKYGIKSDKLRNDGMHNRFLNMSTLDSKYSSSRKLAGTSTLDLSRLSSSSSTSTGPSKPPKATLSRVTRKDSLTKSDADSGLGSIRSSLERKTSSSAMGGSSSPIEIRKTSEVWDKKLSVSYGETMSRGYEDLFQRVDNKSKSRESIGETDNAMVLENIETEEKALTFEEIRKKFDGESSLLKGGFENSQKSSQDDSKASISNGVILDVRNFGQMQYLERAKSRKVADSYGEEVDADSSEKSDSNNSFSSPQTLRRTVLKPIPSAVKINNTVVKKSPESALTENSANLKKRSSPDLKKSPSLSPEKKEFSNLAKLPAIPAADSDSVDRFDLESKRASISSKLGLENRADAKIPPKVRGEKLLLRIEQTLSKQPDLDNEVLNTLSRMRRSPETKPKDFENQTKVIELRRIDATMTTPFEADKRVKEQESKDKLKKGEKVQKGKLAEKTRSSPSKETGKEIQSPQAVKDLSPGVKVKGSSSPKEEKDSQNARERDRDSNKKLEDLTREHKPARKEEGVSVAKETPLWEKHDLSTNLSNRTFTGQASTSHSSNPHLINEKLETPSLQASSPRSSLARSRNSGGEKGGLNGLKNIGNTCFMNSVLQCLSNTKPLLEYLLNEEYLSDINFTISAMKGSLIKAFSNVIQELWAPNTEDRIINTTNFKSQIQKFAPRFMGYAQQDAQEFLRYLLEGLHEDVNRVTVKPQQILTDIDDSLSENQKATEAWKRYLRMDDSKVVDIFVGQLKSTLQCTVCGHCSVTFDPFWDLSLPVPSRTGQPRLSSCLDAFTKEEVLDGEEKPTCSKCETRRKCTKSFSIQKFPKILVLHLKRFSPTERYRGKLSITVDFPLTGLDLSPYAANKGQGCTYNLYAISNHSGTAYGGHYTAYCKHPYTGNWHEYNDSRVSSLSSRSVVSGEAYVLFYELATQTSHL